MEATLSLGWWRFVNGQHDWAGTTHEQQGNFSCAEWFPQPNQMAQIAVEIICGTAVNRNACFIGMILVIESQWGSVKELLCLCALPACLFLFVGVLFLQQHVTNSWESHCLTSDWWCISVSLSMSQCMKSSHKLLFDLSFAIASCKVIHPMQELTDNGTSCTSVTRHLAQAGSHCSQQFPLRN